MKNFAFHRPTSLQDAVAALGSAKDGKLLAGGQSLLPVMKLAMAEPSDLISLSSIAGLDGIAMEGDTLVIGARATHAAVASSEVVAGAIPALAALADGIGDPQVRNRGTLGGSVAHADPAADYPAAVLGLGATIVTERRQIAAADFFTGLFETALAADEIITAVRFPKPEQAAYVKFPNPASRYPVVGVMVAKVGGEVRVAVTGAAEKVFRSSELEQALGADFSEKAARGVQVPSQDLSNDPDASAEYRAHLISIMTGRAVAALGQAA